MTFADLKAGDEVFLDANTFIYHFAPEPVLGPYCSSLLQRIENQELVGFTSTHILAEVAHKLLTIEAHTVFGWGLPGIVNRLRKHPADVGRLNGYRVALTQIAQSRIHLLDVPMAMLHAATTVVATTGLLINDALIVALMQHHGLTLLASHDSDFDRVPGLTRHAPM